MRFRNVRTVGCRGGPWNVSRKESWALLPQVKCTRGGEERLYSTLLEQHWIQQWSQLRIEPALSLFLGGERVTFQRHHQ